MNEGAAWELGQMEMEGYASREREREREREVVEEVGGDGRRAAPAYLHLDIPGAMAAGGAVSPLSQARQTCNKQYGFCGMSLVHAWFEVKFFYVKVVASHAEGFPETLTVRYLPRSIGTELEVNGGRIPPSEHACIHLRRDRMDLDCAEAEVTYVSTDNVRTSGSVGFHILDEDELLLEGLLEYSEDVPPSGEPSPLLEAFDSPSPRSPSKSVRLGWNMDLACGLGPAGCSFARSKHDYSTSAVTLAPPSMEVCVVGRYLGSPLVLTQTVSLTTRRRNSIRRGTLDAIPEGEVLERNSCSLILAEQDAQGRESRGVVEYDEDKVAGTMNYYSLDGFDTEDGHLSWFNTGVRVGVGIGLGMCIGISLGVGLIIRSYQATTRTFRRRFF